MLLMQGVVGALDGMLNLAQVSWSHSIQYPPRKNSLAYKVLAICNLDPHFMYVYAK